MSIEDTYFIFPPIVTRLQLLESERPENLIKFALKSSQKVTTNQPVTRGAAKK